MQDSVHFLFTNVSVSLAGRLSTAAGVPSDGWHLYGIAGVYNAELCLAYGPQL